MTKEQLDRLEDEQIHLEKKISKLELFMISDDFNELCDLQKSLLTQQYNSMCSYNNVLCVRLRILNCNVLPKE